MIKKLILKNFQIHKHLELEFDKRFNIIKGNNDAGKSSIIRAIYWLFFNQPSGSWMQRINKKGEQETTSVKIVFEDDTIITRKKGDGINQYKVDGELYENFGYGVPEQVLNKLKVYPFKTNKEEFNIHVAMQDELPFLVHESGPIKASVLDVLTGNSVLQKAISSFNKDNLKLTNLCANTTNTIESNELELSQLPDLNKAEELLISVEKDIECYGKIKQKLDIIRQHQNDVSLYTKQLETIKIVDISLLKSSIDKYKILDEKLDLLKNYKNQINSFNDDIIELPNVDNCLSLIEKYNKLNDRLNQYVEVKTNYDSTLEKLNSYDKELIKVEKELEDFKVENKFCPMCERKW